MLPVVLAMAGCSCGANPAQVQYVQPVAAQAPCAPPVALAPCAPQRVAAPCAPAYAANPCAPAYAAPQQYALAQPVGIEYRTGVEEGLRAAIAIPPDVAACFVEGGSAILRDAIATLKCAFDHLIPHLTPTARYVYAMPAAAPAAAPCVPAPTANPCR